LARLIAKTIAIAEILWYNHSEEADMRILVVDDDPEIRSLLKRGLAYEGYTVDLAEDGQQALEKALQTTPDLVILDVMMPGLDGLEVAKRLRAGGDVPILLLTARGATSDKVAGLDAGADDYLVKPFALEELLARVRAQLRRQEPVVTSTLRFADLEVNTATRQVTRGGRLLELTAKEFDLLLLFMRHPRQVLTRDIIYDKVWGYDFGGESTSLDVYIHRLRAKMEASGAIPLLHTMRGVGYVLDLR
jgi:two-component system response regulator MprA